MIRVVFLKETSFAVQTNTNAAAHIIGDVLGLTQLLSDKRIHKKTIWSGANSIRNLIESVCCMPSIAKIHKFQINVGSFKFIQRLL